jgi:trehalose-phosphatase
VEEIQASFEEAQTERLLVRPKVDQEQAVAALRGSSGGWNLIFVGLVGVMHQFTVRKKDGSFSEPAYQLANTLSSLASHAENLVIVYASTKKEVLESLFGASQDLVLIAECGAYVKDNGIWSCRVGPEDVKFMDAVASTMAAFSDGTPGASVERKEFSITWFYPKTQREYGAVQSKDLTVHLWAGPLLTAPAEIFSGPGYVEVRHTALNAATEIDRILKLRGGHVAFAVCIGDFVAKDEEIYNVISNACAESGSLHSCFTCTVGKRVTRGSYRLQDSHDATFFLAKISWASMVRRKSSLDSPSSFSLADELRESLHKTL